MTQQHIHTLVKWKKFFGEQHWRCINPDCTYTVMGSAIEGKRTLCTVCHTKEIILTKTLMKLTNPRCDDCSNSKAAKIKRELKSRLNKILEEKFEDQDNQGEAKSNE